MVASKQLMQAYGAWKSAAPGYAEAESYSRAQVDEDFASRSIMRIFNKARVNTIAGFAYSAIPIRVISGRLKLLEPSVTRVGSDEPAEQATDALSQIWEDNELDAELESLWQLVSKFGDAYLFVWPVMETTTPVRESSGDDEFEDDDPEDDDTPVGGNVVGVDILVNDPCTTRAVYDTENQLKIKYVVKTWVDDGSGHTRVNLYFQDHVEKWICPRNAKVDNPDSWERHPEHPDDIPTPLGELPYFHFRNSRPYGTPEHEATYGPQRLINKLVSSLAAVIDYQVGPQRYYMADPSIDDPHQNFTDPDFPEDDDDDPEGAGTSPLSGDPQSVWKLYGRSAGQFEPANPDNIIRPLDRAIQSMSELSGLPRFYFGTGTAETPSGAALRTLDVPTTEIVNSRKKHYSVPLRRAQEYALRLLGHTEVRVQVRWSPTQVITDIEGWQIVSAKIAAGVPTDVALQETGYLPEQVSEWMASAEGVDLSKRLALLQAAAAIVQTVKGAAPPSPAPVPVPAPAPPEVGTDPATDQASPDEVQPPGAPRVPSPPVPAPVKAEKDPTTEAILKAVGQLLDEIMAGIGEDNASA